MPQLCLKMDHGILLLCLALLGGCIPQDDPADVRQEGYRPVYISRETMIKIAVTAPQPLKNPGKIYVQGTYLFVNEINRGIHVIDNQQPTAPRTIAFLSIPGNVDMAVKGTMLYADNATDLVAIDISSPEAVRVVKRIAGVFPTQKHPAYTNVVFECVDDSRGVVVGWEKGMLTNPKCRR
ncbi:MAG: hypothetical protein LH606_10850 [Cytophagaceae bacterium]|nr:hypothetical protein [Cytophagaceae bacterium]